MVDNRLRTDDAGLARFDFESGFLNATAVNRQPECPCRNDRVIRMIWHVVQPAHLVIQSARMSDDQVKFFVRVLLSCASAI